MSVKLRNGQREQPVDRPQRVNAPAEDRNDGFDSESESEDEDEDEDGNLITDKIDSGISDVLAALKSNNANLKDKNVRFFPEIGAEGTGEAQGPTKREKPVYLKDYQRERLLNQGAEQDGDHKTGETAQPTYNDEQQQLRNDLIQQFHGSDDEDDDLLTKREGAAREIPEVKLPDPENDADGFLDAFLNQKGWVPPAEENVPTYNEVVDDEDSDEFDDLSEKFESAYNFRFEDPEAASIVSYARDQNTLRRGKLSSRQKKREKEKEAKQKEAEKAKLEKSKLKKAKVNEVTDKMAQIQEALGEGDENLAELLSKEDLDGDFDTDEWDQRMQKLFNDDYYGDAPQEDVGVDIREGPRLNRKQLKRKAEQFVDSNQDLIEDEMLPAKSNFRYREVEPESFGLTARDILLASDQDLNQFAGIKKLASYRDKSKQDADHKRYSKSKRLRKWRKDVFGSELPPTDEAWQKAKAEAEGDAEPKRKKHKSKK